MDSLILVVWIICGFVGCLIGHFKDRKGAGLILGLLLGPIGWILMLFMPRPEEGSGAGVLAVTVLLCVGFVALTYAAIAAERQRTKEIAQLRMQADEAKSARERKRLDEESARMARAEKYMKWSLAFMDKHGRPPNEEERDAFNHPEPTPAPRPYIEQNGLTTRIGHNTYIGLPTPVAPRATPSAAEVQAEILRKYGAR